jgi:hypothetical protein
MVHSDSYAIASYSSNRKFSTSRHLKWIKVATVLLLTMFGLNSRKKNRKKIDHMKLNRCFAYIAVIKALQTV